MTPERRRHPRTKLTNHSCIQIEPDNGGVVLNLSEDGLSFQAMAPIHVGRIRFWFLCPPNGRIEAAGDLSWTDGTNRVGGLRFVDISEDLREHVSGRLTESIPQPDAFQETDDVADPILHEQSISAHLRNSFGRRVVAGIVISLLAIVGIFVFKAYRRENGDLLFRPEAELSLESESQPLPLGRTPASRSNSPASDASSAGHSNTRGASIMNADKPGRKVGQPNSETTAQSELTFARQSPLKPGSASTTANVLSHPAENAPPPGPGRVATQPKETIVATPPSPNVNQSEGARAAGTAEQESSLPPKPAENPEVVKASVSVSVGLYPSIRVPAELKSQMSRQGVTLQIGQLSSRVDPVYPEGAETQRMEGTVVLHAIIGQDGTVQSVETRSGPALLVPAAANAVRQWRYTPSSVGGQSVEAEEDITVTFRLLKQAARPN
jgi:TonB family protein